MHIYIYIHTQPHTCMIYIISKAILIHTVKHTASCRSCLAQSPLAFSMKGRPKSVGPPSGPTADDVKRQLRAAMSQEDITAIKASNQLYEAGRSGMVVALAKVYQRERVPFSTLKAGIVLLDKDHKKTLSGGTAMAAFFAKQGSNAIRDVWQKAIVCKLRGSSPRQSDVKAVKDVLDPLPTDGLKGKKGKKDKQGMDDDDDDANAATATAASSGPATAASSGPATAASSGPATAASTSRATAASTKPATAASTQPATASTQPATASTQPATAASTQAGTQAGTADDDIGSEVEEVNDPVGDRRLQPLYPAVAAAAPAEVLSASSAAALVPPVDPKLGKQASRAKAKAKAKAKAEKEAAKPMKAMKAMKVGKLKVGRVRKQGKVAAKSKAGPGGEDMGKAAFDEADTSEDERPAEQQNAYAEIMKILPQVCHPTEFEVEVGQMSWTRPARAISKRTSIGIEVNCSKKHFWIKASCLDEMPKKRAYAWSSDPTEAWKAACVAAGWANKLTADGQELPAGMDIS